MAVNTVIFVKCCGADIFIDKRWLSYGIIRCYLHCVSVSVLVFMCVCVSTFVGLSVFCVFCMCHCVCVCQCVYNF